MTALYVCLAVTLALLAVVLVAHYRGDAIGRLIRAVRARWRRHTGVDYGRHSRAATPPHGFSMRDPRGGVDWTGPVPVRVPRRR